MTDLVNRLMTERPGAIKGVSNEGVNTTIGLRADQRTLADELLAEYGSNLHIRLGNFDYPLNPKSTENVCPENPARPEPNESLTSSIELESEFIVPGDDFRGIVKLTNVSSTEISFVARLEPLVLAADSGEVVGYFSQPSAAYEGEPTTLKPGASGEFPFLGFTASCNASLGHTLPPGSYEVVVSMSDPGRVVADPLLTAGPVTIHLRQP